LPLFHPTASLVVLLLLPLLLAVPVPLSRLRLAQPFVHVPSFSIRAEVKVPVPVLVLVLVLVLHLNYNSLDYLTTLRVVYFYDLDAVLFLVEPTVRYSVVLHCATTLSKHLSYVVLVLYF